MFKFCIFSNFMFKMRYFSNVICTFIIFIFDTNKIPHYLSAKYRKSIFCSRKIGITKLA